MKLATAILLLASSALLAVKTAAQSACSEDDTFFVIMTCRSVCGVSGLTFKAEKFTSLCEFVPDSAAALSAAQDLGCPNVNGNFRCSYSTIESEISGGNFDVMCDFCIPDTPNPTPWPTPQPIAPPTPRPSPWPTPQPTIRPTTPRPTPWPTMQPSIPPTTPRPTSAWPTMQPTVLPTTLHPTTTTPSLRPSAASRPHASKEEFSIDEDTNSTALLPGDGEVPPLQSATMAGLSQILFGVSHLSEKDIHDWEKVASQHADKFFNSPDRATIDDFTSIFQVTNVLRSNRSLQGSHRRLQDTVTLAFTESLFYRPDDSRVDVEYLITEPFRGSAMKSIFVEQLVAAGGGLSNVEYVSDVEVLSPASPSPTTETEAPSDGIGIDVVIALIVVIVVVIAAGAVGFFLWHKKQQQGQRNTEKQTGGPSHSIQHSGESSGRGTSRAEGNPSTTAPMSPDPDGEQMPSDPVGSIMSGKQAIADRSLGLRPEKAVVATTTFQTVPATATHDSEVAVMDVPIAEAIFLGESFLKRDNIGGGYCTAKDELFADNSGNEKEESEQELPEDAELRQSGAIATTSSSGGGGAPETTNIPDDVFQEMEC